MTANEAMKEQMSALQQQFPGKSPDDLAYYMKNGDFPKPDTAEVAPGAEMVDKATGHVIANNQNPRPGEESGYSPIFGSGREVVGVRDNKTKAQMTPQEIAANPEAKSVLDQGNAAHAKKRSEQIADAAALAQKQADAQARAFGQAEKMAKERETDLTSTTRTMIEAAPRVIDLANKVKAEVAAQTQQLGPAAGRWSEFWAGKIGEPNPEFTQLRTNTDLLQTALVRMHFGARGGQQMLAQFKDMIDAGKQSPENLQAAADAIVSYAQDVAKTAPGGATLQQPAAPAAPAAPAGGFDWNAHPLVK